MDAMQLAQLRRQVEWFAQEARHTEHDLQVTELALEGNKKKVEELRKKVAENKRKLATMNQDVLKAQDEARRKNANERHP